MSSLHAAHPDPPQSRGVLGSQDEGNQATVGEIWAWVTEVVPTAVSGTAIVNLEETS